MNKLAVILLLFISTTARAQYGMGVKINDSAYNAIVIPTPPSASVFGGLGYKIDTYISLKKFTPVPQNQGNCESCIGWSCAYAGYTTVWAIAHHITDKKIITAQAYSPEYLYYHLADSCKEGAEMPQALQLMKEGGIPLAKDLQALSPKANLPADKLHKVVYYNKLFEFYGDSVDKVGATRLSLKGFMPVAIVGLVDSGLLHLNKTNTWVPKTTKERIPLYHAMCVIGCDDALQRFEIMNSWGEAWGNGGYFYISYKDYARMVRYAFQMDVAEDGVAVNNVTNMVGDVEIDKNSAAQRAKFTEVKPEYGRHQFELWRGIQQGDTYRFKLVNLKKDKYVYIIRVSQANHAEVLYPASKVPGAKKTAAIVTANGKLVVTPLNEAGAPTFKAGDVSQYCILYAGKPIDIARFVQIINNSKNADKLHQLDFELRDRYIPDSYISFDTGNIQAGGEVLAGDIIPLHFLIAVR